MVFLLTIPSSVGLAVLGETMIAVVYQWRRFHPYDTHQTAIALTCYAVGLAGYSAVKVLAPAFYALNDARTPMLVSLASILINYAVASTMVRFLGHAGLALSTSTVALFSFVILLMLIRRRVGGIEGAHLLATFWKVLFASAVMGAVCAGSDYTVLHWLGPSRTSRIVDLLISIPLGVAVFYSICRLARVGEMEAAGEALTARFRRRV
jgi:putative peptidoglycan lipid II flippase